MARALLSLGFDVLISAQRGLLLQVENGKTNHLATAPPDGAATQHPFVRGISPTMAALERTLSDIAATDIPILLVGESGTGKEVIALEIHRLSQRRDKPFVKCGCAGLTPEILAAKLHSCDATDPSSGACGSLFLDEIAQLDLASQERLLNLLPEGISAPAQLASRARLICCTTRSLEDEMRAGRFREELYYRINGVYLRLPPLRQRTDDIPILLDFFLEKYAALFARSIPKLSGPAMRRLLQHSWPGNVRELENMARKIVALGNEQVALADLAVPQAPQGPQANPAREASSPQPPASGRSLKEAARKASRDAERALILQQLERTHWNRKKTARELQISYKALLYKLKQLGLGGNDAEGQQGES